MYRTPRFLLYQLYEAYPLTNFVAYIIYTIKYYNWRFSSLLYSSMDIHSVGTDYATEYARHCETHPKTPCIVPVITRVFSLIQ